MKKDAGKEINKLFNTQSIKMFLEDVAEVEKTNRETFVKVKKGDDKSFAQAVVEDAPYTIEVERPLGANLSKDKNFASYLGGIFGSKAVDFTAERVGKETEKVVFSITGHDKELLKRIKRHQNHYK